MPLKSTGCLWMYQAITGFSRVIPACYFLISQNDWMSVFLTGLFVLVAASLAVRAGIKEGPMWRDRMIALVIFMVINIVFWACFEQAGTSLTLFADRNVSREIFGMDDAPPP